ncbi:MAG: SET domain-containing protein-lysine N-methyltransferase [Xenococcaceae cyanobacterium]
MNIQNQLKLQDKTDITCAKIQQHLSTRGYSLHATREFQPGQVITYFGARAFLDSPTYLTVQFNDKHVLFKPKLLQYINHSCNPNVFLDMEGIEFHRGRVLAIKQIKEGDELTFFYPSTEYSMIQPFKCLCASENCLNEIKGAKYIPLDIIRNYSLSSHIKLKLI